MKSPSQKMLGQAEPVNTVEENIVEGALLAFWGAVVIVSYLRQAQLKLDHAA